MKCASKRTYFHIYKTTNFAFSIQKFGSFATKFKFTRLLIFVSISTCFIHSIITLVEKKCVPCKDLARFSFKVLQDNAFFCKISYKKLARKKFPCKIFQGKHFLARSFKENISLQDLARNKFPCKILQVIAFLQGSCKILARNAFFLDQGNILVKMPFSFWGGGGIPNKVYLGGGGGGNRSHGPSHPVK